jgi:Na+/melibiose symporter-like transporter
MFELVKLLWDLVMIRDASRRGLLSWRIWLLSFGVVIILYGTAVPAAMLWEKCPQYEAIFIAVMVVDGVGFVAFVIWAWRWQVRQRAQKRAAQRV